MDPKTKPDPIEEQPKDYLSGGEPDAPPQQPTPDHLAGGPDDDCL